jgi:class 3 adenylate cyclase
MAEVDLEQMLRDLDTAVGQELASAPEVIDKGHNLDVDALPITARKWHKLQDAVAVVADLKSSTQLGFNKYPQSTASIYEAAVGGAARIFSDFEADFISIQGDGGFALYWGDKRFARAVCAGITIKTFSENHLVARLEKKWSTLPETGFKVGVASSSLLVKRVGIPQTPTHQEPVWAGKAVNYAAKAAQQADRHEMVVTGTIWDWASANEYLALTCSCDTPNPDLWHDVTIEKIPDMDPEREGKRLTSRWCDIHGAEYCSAILAGQSRRKDVTDQLQQAQKAEFSKALRAKAKEDRDRKRSIGRL